jgi:hypothetical protein
MKPLGVTVTKQMRSELAATELGRPERDYLPGPRCVDTLNLGVVTKPFAGDTPPGGVLGRRGCDEGCNIFGAAQRPERGIRGDPGVVAGSAGITDKLRSSGFRPPERGILVDSPVDSNGGLRGHEGTGF